LRALIFRHPQTTGKKMMFLTIFWTAFIPYVMLVLALVSRAAMSTFRNLRSDGHPLQVLVRASEPARRQKSA